ncbi:LD-carboxypeptidase [Parvularcula sp. ZS-1/3]|uniref:LD-carboxypeptidase n=1 Tax=Parvularcula mediterranea TaxID=2732508 RepID=A0A7Y3RKD7_9PROT|nr:LD-carboxypeptidase [Parvularcula mediterranea]NNU15610.1 LD-carboxypeptidase [Parvularcula mediterranea]
MRVAVVAPSRSLPQEAAEEVEALARKAGVELVIDPRCFLAEGHFAGSDQARADAFVSAANDPSFDAIWFARGGYGACRILDRVLPQLGEAAEAKTYLGYSDGGYLLAALDRNGIGHSVHGSMLGDVLRDGGEKAIEQCLMFLSSGQAEEPAVVLNLAVLASLVATPYLPDLNGRTLIIEEVDEHLYAIDRMLFTAFSSGRLAGVKGLKLGRINMVPENDIDFGQTAEEIVRAHCACGEIPFLGHADVGHDVENKVVPWR